MVCEKGEYKGYPTITLKKSSDDEYGWSFGTAKARLFIQHLPQIKQWLEEQEQEEPTATGKVYMEPVD